MASNKQYLRIPFTTTKGIGFAHYFLSDWVVVFKTITWDGEDEKAIIEKGIKMSERWLKKYTSPIKGAYLKSKFSDSPMKTKLNSDMNLVFATILNLDRNDKCLKGKYKLGSGKEELIKLSDYPKPIGILELIKLNTRFSNLFYLYNYGKIKDKKTLELFDVQKTEKFVKESLKDIKTFCDNNPTN